MGSLICFHGGDTRPLITDPCTQEAVYNIPLSGEDFLAPAVSTSGDSHPNQADCPVGMNHVSLYRQHVRQCMCHIPQCLRVGPPITFGSTAIYECTERRKERIIADQIPIVLHTKHGGDLIKTQTKEEPGIPPMPPLEAIEPPNPPASAGVYIVRNSVYWNFYGRISLQTQRIGRADYRGFIFYGPNLSTTAF